MTPRRIVAALQDPAASVAGTVGVMGVLAGNLAHALGVAVHEVVSMPYVLLTLLLAANVALGSVRAVLRSEFSWRRLLGRGPSRWLAYTCGVAVVSWSGLMVEWYGLLNPAPALLTGIYCGAAVYEVRSVAAHLAHAPVVGGTLSSLAHRLASMLGDREAKADHVDEYDQRRRGHE